MPEPAQQVDADAGSRRKIARRLGLAVGALFMLVMAAGADYPPPPGFALLVAVAVVIVLAVGRLVPPLLGIWDTAGPARALARAALVGFAGGALIWTLASSIQLITGASSVGLGPQALGFFISAVAVTIAAVAVAGTSRLLDAHVRRSP